MISDALTIIIVFFNPSDRHKEQAVRLSSFYNLIIVDNSIERIAVFDSNPKITYISLGENKGIAYAQNIGIKRALEKESVYILFQDQDSSLNPEDVELLLTEYKSIKSCDSKIAAIGPVIINEGNGKEYKSEMGKGLTNQVSSIISSGMLVELAVIDQVGGMDESLFIDNVDHEWCWRAKNKGYNVYMTRKVELKHSVGEKTKSVIGIQIIKSSSFRAYYKFRNNLWLTKRHYVPISWKIKTICHMCFDYVMYFICFIDYGTNYIKAANRGIVDGLNKKYGPVY